MSAWQCGLSVAQPPDIGRMPGKHKHILAFYPPLHQYHYQLSHTSTRSSDREALLALRCWSGVSSPGYPPVPRFCSFASTGCSLCACPLGHPCNGGGRPLSELEVGVQRRPNLLVLDHVCPQTVSRHSPKHSQPRRHSHRLGYPRNNRPCHKHTTRQPHTQTTAVR